MTFFTFIKIIFRRFFWYILIICIILLAVVVGFLYKHPAYYSSPDTIAESEGRTLVKRVGELAFLPPDEVPTVAKVSNPSLLREQAFFVDAKTGDVVLIYTNAKKAILYDPTANKIVNMSTLNIGSLNKAPETTTTNTDTQF
jgi:hypothetical protein